MPPMLPQSLHSLPHPIDLRSLLSSIPSDPLSGTPTRSLNSLSLASLFRRQITTVTATAAATSANPIIPAFYAGLNDGPPPGTVVGIVFGSVAAFLLVLWFIYTCLNFSNQFGRSSVIGEREVRVQSGSSRRRSMSSRNESETIEVARTQRSRSRTRTPPRRQSTRRETVIIEETRRPQPAPRSEPDDVVEVFEEHSPPRRESKKEKRINEGFRTVDPEAFGGGDRPMRKVSRSRR